MRFLVVLLLCLCLVPGIEAQKKRRKTSSVSSLNSKLRSVRQNQAKLQKEIRKAKVRTQWVVKDLDKVDHRLTVVSGQLEETNQHLSANKVAQKRITNELIETGHRLDETKEQLRRRLRAIYEEGDGSYLTVLTGSQSLGDLAVRADMMQRIAEHDRELFDRYVGLRRAVSSRKRQQDTVVREIGQLAVHHRRKASELSSVRREKQEALQSLRAKQNQLRAMLAQMQSDENAIEGQIAAYMRRLAAERRRRMIAKRVRRGRRMVTVMVPAPAMQFTGRLGRPVNGPMTSRFGMRHHPILRVSRLHAGVDFGAGYGSPIFAAASGVVIGSSYMRGYGNCVIIDHGSGISTVYAHCSRVNVRAGQSIKRGQRIAAVGSTGLSTGPHLHFEVRRNGRPINPSRF